MKKTKFLIIFVSLLVLTGCSGSNQLKERLGDKNSRFESLEELKAAFVEAGGQCWGWRIDNSAPLEEFGWIGKGDCDSSTVLIVYADGVDVMAEAMMVRNTNINLGLKTSYLIGDNWTINSDQIQTVYPKMGGTLMTR